MIPDPTATRYRLCSPALPVMGTKRTGITSLSEKPRVVRVMTFSFWSDLPTGKTSRPPTLSCCLSGSGTRAGAARES